MSTEKFTMADLYRTLDERQMPEFVAHMILHIERPLIEGGLPESVRNVLKGVAKPHQYSYMSTDFFRTMPDLRNQLDLAKFYLKVTEPVQNDVDAVLAFIGDAGKKVGRVLGKTDYKNDRLNREERRAAGFGTMPRRRYNKIFRITAKLEEKAHRLARAQAKRSITLASKNRLASKVTQDMFSSDLLTACFIAYYVARANMRSLFTVGSQTRAYDTVCQAMMKHLRTSPTTNWFAIAHVMPDHDIIKRLNDEEKGLLLGRYYDMLITAGKFLDELWQTNSLSQSSMVVRPGNDSSTWNLSAGAWNKLRDGWFALCFEMGAEELLERQCFGKVMRLIAADVAAWHRSYGENKHEDTDVWAALPLPWLVLRGTVASSRQQVEELCNSLGIDPLKKGWVARVGKKKVERFSPTPELVHGVVVACPEMARVMRKIGVFSGKSVNVGKADINLGQLREAVDESRSNHALNEAAKKELQ